MSSKNLNVAVIGLGFGTQFIPNYQRHPNTNMYEVCRHSREALDVIGDAFGIDKRFVRFEDVLADPTVDFVHINTPLHTHYALSIAALKAGKHVMCTVPMGLSVDGCRQIVELAGPVPCRRVRKSPRGGSPPRRQQQRLLRIDLGGSQA